MRRLIFCLFLILTIAWLTACSKAPTEPVIYTLEMTEYAFEPSSIELKVGQPVIIEVVNNGTIEHEAMFGRDVVITMDRPDGYHHDMFAESGVQPQMEGNQPEMDMSEHGHGASSFMLTLPEPGDSATIAFIPTEDMVGEWEIGCFVQDGVHYDAGMKATLTVTQ
ncbi:MAG: hypothetical protein EHM70_19930 [Chloroflexota bacterium]|nr:MAG: hypothetical protein EHM70_19930 [Chloroflexota bacterium]